MKITGVSLNLHIFFEEKHHKNHEKTMVFCLQNRSETATARKIDEERFPTRFPRPPFGQKLHLFGDFWVPAAIFVGRAGILAPPRGLRFFEVIDLERPGDAWVPA